MLRRPRIGLALGSGSARGLAHIGVLRALQEAGLQADLLAGTSIGALVGALAASGKVDDLEAAFRVMDWRGILALLDPVFPRSGLIDGRKVERFLQQMLPVQNFEELPLPFRAVTTDILTGAEVVLSEGPLVEAVHASFAVPGIFTPLRRARHILVDGGLVNPVPVSTVREMGASFIIAVDLNHDIVQKRNGQLRGRAGALFQSSGAVSPQAPSLRERLQAGLQAVGNPVVQQLAAWLAEKEAVSAGAEMLAEPGLPELPVPGIIEMLLGSIYITQARLTQVNLLHEAPHVLIQPPLGDIRFLEFDRASEIIDIGYHSARQALDAAGAILPAGRT